MQSRWLLQFLSALSSLILLKAQDVIGSGPSCVRSRPANGGQTRVNFLREDAAGVRSLYLTLWSEDMRPVSCEVTSNPQVTEKYRAHCDRGGTQGQDITQRFNISVLLAPDAPCAFASSSAPKFTGRVRRDGTRSRRKRSWIFPGTLWCGTGSRAIGYDQLGMFERADRCCREHDHCQHFIPALTKNYGVFNPNVYTVSHCDCDKRFRRCLLGVNDSISNMVAYSFFNILKVPCFEFNQQRRCTQIHWCKEATEALHAVFKKPLPFNRTDVTSNYLDDVDSNNVTSSERQHVTESPVITPHTTKRKHRFGCRDPHSGDTFYHRRRKGKGCKRHRKLSTASASMSRAHNTTPSVETSLLHSSKSTTLIPTKKRGGKKKSTRKSLSSQPTQRSQDGSQVTTNSYPQTTSTTHQPSSPPAVNETTNKTATTHRPSSPPAVTEATNKTATTHRPSSPPAITETTNKTATTHQPSSPPAITETTNKRTTTQSHCCGSSTPLRGDRFHPHCKSCLEQKTTPHINTAEPSTTTHHQPIKVTNPEILWLKTTTETPEQNMSSTTDSAILTSATLKAAASIQNGGTTQKQMDSHLLWNNTSQEVMGRTKAPNTERGLKRHSVLHNMTDSQLLCLRLNRLDECKYKILPLEKKYNLQNMESKTAYHCDCTNRLAVQIKSFKKPSILPTLLMDFVSQYCFNLPKEEDCRSRKSCSGGFTKASDLLQALKKIEEKDIGRVRKSGRKRRNPVRLSKRCLRLEREDDIMAQLT